MEAIFVDKNTDFDVKKSQAILVQPKTTKHITNKYYFLSNLDQVVTHQTETVFYYKQPIITNNYKSTAKAGETIRVALSEILVHFYPLAGKLIKGSNGKLIVECTNDGVPFVEAEANCYMMDVVNVLPPNSLMLQKLIYNNLEAKSLLDLPLMTVQVTRFKCGGFTLGMTISHCISDGLTAELLMNSWAESARGVPSTTTPFMDRSIIKPRRPLEFGNYPFDSYIAPVDDMCSLPPQDYDGDQVLYKSFRFDRDKITKLKSIVMEEDHTIKTCSTFNVLTAFTWRARTKALKQNPEQVTKLLIVVDGRNRLNPPLPEGYFGNGIVVAMGSCKVSELVNNPLSFAVKLVEGTVRSVDEGFVSSWIDYFEERRAKPVLSDSFLITSWTRLNLAVDFGWGNPMEWGCTNIVAKELSLFLAKGNKKQESHIEIFLGLPVIAVDKFEQLLYV